MKLKHIKTTFLATAIGFSLMACSVATESNELSVDSQTFTFEDIYEGSNSATVEVDMTALIEANESLKGKGVEGASIASITLMKNDSIGFGEITSAKMQIMGEGEETPMVTVGINTAVDGASKEVSLDIIEDVDLEEYVKGGKVYLILDGNFSADNEDYQDVSAKITFSIETEKK